MKAEIRYRFLVGGLVLLLLLANFPPSSNSAQVQESGEPTYIKVLFQGGNATESMGKVLLSLKMMDALPCETHVVESGETIQQVFMKQLSLPAFSSSLAVLAADLNGIQDQGALSAPLPAGKSVCYPAAKVETRVFVAEFTKSSMKELNLLNRYKQIFGDQLREGASPDGKNVTVEADVYELEIKVQSGDQLAELLDQLRGLSSQNVKILTQPPPTRSDNRSFTINLEGGDVSGNAADVIKSLLDVGVIKTASHNVVQSENAGSIYKNLLGIPDGSELVALASELNKMDLRRQILKEGDSLVYPQIRFKKYLWTQRLNLVFLKDRLRLQEIEADEQHGARLIMKRTNVSETEVVLHLYGYRARITVDGESALEQARAALRKFDSKNVLVLFDTIHPESKGYAGEGSTNTEADQFWNKVIANQKIPKGEQGDLSSYLGLKVRIEDDPKRCEPSGACSVVVVLDQAVDKTHPDLAQAMEIDEDELPPAIGLPFEGENQNITVGSFKDGPNHGTHMAGIIGSQDNNYGLIGINPHATIKSLNWEALSKNDLYDELCNRQQSKRYQIYVFANKWKLDLGDETLNQEADREKDQIAKFIALNNSLWIVAAGDDGKDLNWSFVDFTPMNLGDKRNVVVVTACEDCFNENARLATNASYSTSPIPFVHIAAPNGPIPSTINAGNYDAVPGTSQATALTAGVMSRMIDNWSSSYLKDSALAKTWIQLTATPFPGNGESHGSTFGILNITRALLNPDKNYLQTDQPDSSLSPIESRLSWARPTLPCRDVKTNAIKSIDTPNIRRIFKQGNRWIFYTTFIPTDGKVFKFGPCTFSDNEISKPLLHVRGQNDPHTLNTIFDLLLSKNIRLAP